MTLSARLFGTAYLITIVILLSQGALFDDYVSDLFFRNGRWLWPKQDETLTFWLHDFIKYVFLAVGISSLVFAIIGYRKHIWTSQRQGALLLSLTLLICPLVVAELKADTHVFCPSKIERYQGKIPDDYRHLSLPLSVLKQAKCFPAAHASPGFALFILGVVATTRRRKIMGYALGGIVGSGLSLIQLGRGEHFLSHCIASAIVAFLIAQTLTFLATEVLPQIRQIQKRILWQPYHTKAKYIGSSSI